MAIDEKYQDNIILKKDAFQNLLTNIKNYPIVDIDYVTESDIDELHGDEIWPNYTNGMPCIKITYGDDRSTKGNIIFKEDWRKYLNKANKEMARLNSILNEYERRRARWVKIYNQNKALEAEKLKWIQALGNHQELLSEAKQDFLLLGLNFLYNWGHPQYEDYYLAYTENNVDMITNVNSSNYQADFPSTFSTVTLEYNDVTKAWTDNVHIGTNVTVNFLDLTSSIQIQQVLQNIYDLHLFTADGENTIAKKENILQGFISFVQQYNFLILQDLNSLNEIPQSSIINGALRALTVEDSYDSNATYFYQRTSGAQAGTFGIATSLTAANFRTNIEDSSITYYTYKDNVDDYIKYLDFTLYNPNYKYADFYGQFKEIANSILEDIANAVGNTLTICQNELEAIDAAIKWLKTETHIITTSLSSDNTDLTNYYLHPNGKAYFWGSNGHAGTEGSKDWDDGTFRYHYKNPQDDGTTFGPFTFYLNEDGSSLQEQDGVSQEEDLSITDYKWLINTIKKGINEAATQTGPNENEDRTLYGYKYVKVGSNIQFDNNYSTTDPAVNEVTEFIGTENDVQASGTFRITINGHTYEIPIKGIGNISDQNVTIASGSSSSPNSQIILYKEEQNNGFDIGVTGNTNLHGDLQVVNNLIVGEDLLPGSDSGLENIGGDGANQRWGTIYATNGDFSNNVTIGGNLVPNSSNVNDESIGTSDNPWPNAYITSGQFDEIQIKNPNYDEDDPNETDLPYVDLSDYINNAVTYDNNHQLYVTNTADGIKYTDENDVEHNGFDSNSSRTYSGDDNASIHTEGGIYAEKNIYATRVFNAVFNDYAEYRSTIDAEAGRIVIDNDDGSLSLSSTRLQPGAQVISDTFGHAMGATNKCQTPLAVAGRALVYTYKDRNEYHAGMAVCSAPNGTVDIMTREEIREYPDCIIGIVSEIPDYEVWGSDNVKVNGRIWIKVK